MFWGPHILQRMQKDMHINSNGGGVSLIADGLGGQKYVACVLLTSVPPLHLFFILVKLDFGVVPR